MQFYTWTQSNSYLNTYQYCDLLSTYRIYIEKLLENIWTFCCMDGTWIRNKSSFEPKDSSVVIWDLSEFILAGLVTFSLYFARILIRIGLAPWIREAGSGAGSALKPMRIHHSHTARYHISLELIISELLVLSCQNGLHFRANRVQIMQLMLKSVKGTQ